MWKIVKYKGPNGNLQPKQTKILFNDQDIGDVVGYLVSCRGGDENEYLEIKIKNPSVFFEERVLDSFFGRIRSEDVTDEVISEDVEFAQNALNECFEEKE